MLDTRLNKRMREVPVRCLLRGQEAKVFNVSVGGALVEKVLGDAKVSERITAEFHFTKGGKMEVEAIVLRVQERSIALKFVNESQELIDRLKEAR